MATCREAPAALTFLGMESSELWAVLRRELDAIRSEYLAFGREDEFDCYVAGLRADDRWPFDAER